MRKLFVCAFAFLCLTANVSAQTAKDIRKERQEIRKASKSELNEKATKTARKDAKKLKKEGWITVPGALPLEKQLDKSYMVHVFIILHLRHVGLVQSFLQRQSTRSRYPAFFC